MTLIIIFFLFFYSFNCNKENTQQISSPQQVTQTSKDSAKQISLSANQQKVLDGAKKTLADNYEYDMSMAYYTIDFPNGDIDETIGVCTDVIVRALRKSGITDLQKAINDDVKSDWNAYPMKRWKAKKPDSNIDHRRVMNLEVWFAKYWQTLNNDADFQPGDIVVWDMNQDGYSDHIGIVSDTFANGNYYVIHNHPNPGYVANEDKLHLWEIIGHYRIKD
ncbi:MAG TPA: DUF1287 domain-containing protein [Ignavibacteria bacterium]|nr:DUF1287 domain-containing protein [Ignavibacteria bacterium]